MRKFDCEPKPVVPFWIRLPSQARSHQPMLRDEDFESTNVPPSSQGVPSIACVALA